MEGRRVTHQAPQRNPLYVLFLCLIAAVFVLLLIAIVLGAKLGAAQKALTRAQTQVEELKAALRDETQEPDQTAPEDTQPAEPGESGQTEPGDQTSEPAEPGEPGQTAAPEQPSSWLDLDSITGVSVKPTTLLDKYYPYYTTDTLNLRGGPGTEYNRIISVEKGEQVEVAARQGNWMFVRVGSRYGWMIADYLSTTKPAAPTTPKTPAPTTNPGGGTGRGSEATSGNLNRR